jgi:hypothetical protein
LYTRYIHDILIVYNSTVTTYERLLQHINTIHSNIQLNPTQETNGNVSFLDSLITRKPTCLTTDIYCKATTTDTAINFLSNDPLEHKLAAYRFLIRKMFTLPLNKERQEEWKNTQQIARNNNLPSYQLFRLKQRIQQRATQPQPPPPATTDTNTHWATFKYTSAQIKKITNLFKHTNVKITFKCNNNTLSQLTKPVTKTPALTPHNRNGIYALACNTCKLTYVGQISQSLKLCYQEHKRYIKNNNPQLTYAQHILHNRHEYGPMDKTMTLLKPLNNSSFLIPYKQLFIQFIHQEGKLISEQNPGEPNLLLQLATDPSQPPT